MSQLLRIYALDIDDGTVVFGCVPDESMYNGTGTIHGGLACGLLDFVCSCALLTTLPEGKVMTSVELKVNFLKAIHSGSGRLRAVGKVVKAGARIGFTEGKVTDVHGAVVATATSSLLIFDS